MVINAWCRTGWKDDAEYSLKAIPMVRLISAYWFLSKSGSILWMFSWFVSTH